MKQENEGVNIDNECETSSIQYQEGAKMFSKFVKRPEHYKNAEAILRVRMDGLYGGWRLRDEVFEGFGFIPGDALYLNDIYVLGLDNIDVEIDVWCVDCFAAGSAADWLENNDVTRSSIFEGKFRFAYETVEKGAGSRASAVPVDAKIANLVLIEGIKIIAQTSILKPKKADDEIQETFLNLQRILGKN